MAEQISRKTAGRNTQNDVADTDIQRLRILSSDAVQPYFTGENAINVAHSATKTAGIPYFFTNFAMECGDEIQPGTL